jgi:hypothetical protein
MLSGVEPRGFSQGATARRVEGRSRRGWRRLGSAGVVRDGRGPRRAGTREGAEEQGAMLVLATFAIIMLLMVAGVAIDLGTAYASGRQMQNAADASALAATNELECLIGAPGSTAPPPGVGCQDYPATPASVYSVAQQVATDNGVVTAGAGMFTCEMVYYDPTTGGYTHSQAFQCDTPYGPTGWYSTGGQGTSQVPPGNYADLAGVYVKVGSSQSTSFGGITGTTTTAEHRQAAAAIQPADLIGSLFFACAYTNYYAYSGPSPNPNPPNLLNPESSSGEAGFVPLQTSSSQFPANWDLSIFVGQSTANPGPETFSSSGGYSGTAGYTVNPAALYNASTNSPIYLLWGPQQADNCDLHSSSSKGLVAQLNGDIPTSAYILTGGKVGQVNPPLAASGCIIDPSSGTVTGAPGCILIVPIAVGSNGGSGSSGQVWCVAFGKFVYVPGASSTNSASFGFLGLVQNISVGPSASGAPAPDGLDTVRLVQ